MSLQGVKDFDVGRGVDGKPVFGVAASQDTGQGADTGYWEPFGTFFIVAYDIGHGQEGDTEPAIDSDAGTGFESASMAGFPADTDESFLSDYSYDIIITVMGVSDQDSGSGDDSIWFTDAPVYDVDAGNGLEVAPAVQLSDLDAGSGSEQLAYVLEIFPYPPSWLFSEPSGAFQLTWFPVGRSERLAVAEIIDRLHEADFIGFVSDTDVGGGSESSLPTATIEQFAVAPAVVCSNASEADLVLLSGAST
jgi:hypothetical protein